MGQIGGLCLAVVSIRAATTNNYLRASVIYHPEAATARRVPRLNIQATIQAVEALYCYVTVILGIVFLAL